MLLLETNAALSPGLAWGVFLGFVFALLALDLGVFHRHSAAIGARTALKWTAFWVSMGLLFGVWVYWLRGRQSAIEYFGCYLTEEALSVDNLFVFLAIFGFFRVPAEFQHKVLFWGILGAMVMRALFILAGIEVVSRFSWTFYVFGAILVFTGLKLLRSKEEEIEPERSLVVRAARKLFPISARYDGDRFFTTEGERRMATPMFLVLLAVESSDIVFAVDSVPAALGISQDRYIVYSSNIMAILGLRSIYFALAAVAGLFHYLKFGLAVVLVFIGGKMIAAEGLHWHLDALVSLAIVAGVLVLSVCASLLFPQKRAPGAE